MTIAIRDALAGDHGAILALNLESEALLSPMDAARLLLLESQAAYLRVAVDETDVVAFLLAFVDGADYDSPNYRWFAERYDSFLYVDRIAVSTSSQGKGIGTMLYQDLFEFARVRGIRRIVCEYYSIPLNQTSQRFHTLLGFTEIGTQWLPDFSKQVSFQLAST